jgi:hypothetical protein
MTDVATHMKPGHTLTTTYEPGAEEGVYFAQMACSCGTVLIEKRRGTIPPPPPPPAPEGG